MDVSGSSAILAGAIAATGLLTFPLERRLFRAPLSTQAKLGAYAGVMLLLWTLTAAAIAVCGWPALSRSPAPVEAWLPAPGPASVTIGALVAAYFLLAFQPLFGSLRGVRSRGAYAAAMRKQGAALPGFLPSGALECAGFALVGLTAGVCEEILFRGFLIRFLHESPLHLNIAGALALSCLIFGLNHAYQGVKGVVGTSIAGLGVGMIFLLSGQLLPAIVVHALVDLQVALVLWPIAEPAQAESSATSS